MSTKTPPRGRLPQRQKNMTPDENGEVRQTEPRRRVFDLVVYAVVAALVVMLISTWAGTSSPRVPVSNNGYVFNGQVLTLKPGKTAAAPSAAPAQVNVTDLPEISEISSGNKGAIAAEDGKYYDWIELYNPTGRTINLAGFGLSDNPDKPSKFVLPAWQLQPGKCVVVFANGKASTQKQLNAGFKLKKSGQTVVLTDPNRRVIQSVQCPPMPEYETYSMDLSKPGTWAFTDKYTPGFPNTDEGYAQYQQASHATAPIYINEVMASNKTTLADEDGDYGDWVELYNPTNKAVDITGWGLSDTAKEPKRWVFPQMKIEAGQYLVVFLSRKDRAVAGKELHTNFRLSSFNGQILLSNLTGQIVSEVPSINLQPDKSLARIAGSDKWQTSDKPTPGKANN